MYHIREHFNIDCVYTVVEIDSHHGCDAAYSAAGLLLKFRREGYSGLIGLRDAESCNETDNCSGYAPFDDEGTALPELGDELHDVDFGLVVVVWLVVDIFLHISYFRMLAMVAIIVAIDDDVVAMLRMLPRLSFLSRFCGITISQPGSTTFFE